MTCSKCNATTAAQCVENNCHFLESEPSEIELRLAALEMKADENGKFNALIGAWTADSGKPMPWKKVIELGEILGEFDPDEAKRLREFDTH